MHFRKMNENYIFREFTCHLTKKETAKLCFKSVRTVTEWDKGKPIPAECKRLMRYASGRELSDCEEWERFIMHKNKLELPTGQRVSAQEIMAGIALLSINSELEILTTTKLLKFARAISRAMTR